MLRRTMLKGVAACAIVGVVPVPLVHRKSSRWESVFP